jgi:hypothetical protein
VSQLLGVTLPTIHFVGEAVWLRNSNGTWILNGKSGQQGVAVTA